MNKKAFLSRITQKKNKFLNTPTWCFVRGKAVNFCLIK